MKIPKIDHQKHLNEDIVVQVIDSVHHICNNTTIFMESERQDEFLGHTVSIHFTIPSNIIHLFPSDFPEQLHISLSDKYKSMGELQFHDEPYVFLCGVYSINWKITRNADNNYLETIKIAIPKQGRFLFSFC